MGEQVTERIRFDSGAALIALVGQEMRRCSSVAGRTFAALGRENVHLIAIAQNSSECNLAFLVAERDLKKALLTIHREFDLSGAALADAAGKDCSVSASFSVA
jgi:aspartokinase